MGIIFTIFFLVFGMVEFIRAQPPSTYLSMFLISAIFFVGWSIQYYANLRKNTVTAILDVLSKSFAEAAKTKKS